MVSVPRGDSVLHLVVKDGKLTVLDMLLGARRLIEDDINVLDKKNKTPIYYAIRAER